MMQRSSWAIAIAIVTMTAFAAAQGQPAKGFTPPRTPWGDPDLQGVWPGTEMVGVPLQRQQQFGERNVLTEEEFQARVIRRGDSPIVGVRSAAASTRRMGSSNRNGSASGPCPSAPAGTTAVDATSFRIESG